MAANRYATLRINDLFIYLFHLQLLNVSMSSTSELIRNFSDSYKIDIITEGICYLDVISGRMKQICTNFNLLSSCYEHFANLLHLVNAHWACASKKHNLLVTTTNVGRLQQNISLTDSA